MEPSPLAALVAGTLLIAVLVVLFWPERGLLARSRRALHATERVQLEDSLKHLFDCEYKGRIANLESLSGAVAVSGNRAAELLEALESKELVLPVDGGYRLSEEGRTYALKMVRIHRLWERYLAEETSVEPTAWHQEAELREHSISTEEADALSASLGHPRYDPHGDPIPTADGEILPAEGRPLTEMKVGSVVEIVHVEDEPEAIYAQLSAEGLHPGMRLRVSESTPQRMRFDAEAEEHVLAPVLASNLWVMPVEQEVMDDVPFLRLSGLSLGESGRVVSMSPALRGPERRRLLDLGLVPGTVVQAEIQSPAGDPMGYRIRGAIIALRRTQADLVRVEAVS